MYTIQTRKNHPFRSSLEQFGTLNKESEWSNYSNQYNEIEAAEDECEKLIKRGTFKAEDIRIIEVVRVFEADINVNVKDCKKKA